MLAPLITVLALTAAPVSPPQDAGANPPDARLREAWSYLHPEEQRDVVDWFMLEVSHLDTFQIQLVRFVVAESPVDAGYWPEDEPPPVYDPKEHAPKLVIKRKKLKPTHRLAIKARETMLVEEDPTALRSAWRYDWGTGELRRLADPDDPERLFENALRGYPPQLDLARALVLLALDDGELRTAHAAFGHAYTDRSGRVYPGLTLHDAWSSGTRMEMPDVDALGIIHDVLDDWETWKSPVPSKKHDALYRRIDEIFGQVRAHRALREALADVFATGEPPLLEHGPHVDRFHALWEKHASTPVLLKAELPESGEEQLYLEALVQELGRDGELTMRGRERQRTLVANARLVRATLARVLTEFGAMEREKLPPKKKKPKKDRRKRGG